MYQQLCCFLLCSFFSLGLYGVEEKNVENFFRLQVEEEKIFKMRQFVGVGQFKINYTQFGFSQGARGAIAIAPGRTEFSLKYLELAYDLIELGFSPIYIIDHRGQGLSQRKLKDPYKGHVDRFNYYVEDLKKWIEQEILPNISGKLYLIGQSMGGAIASGYLSLFPKNKIEKAILTAPMLQIPKGYSEWFALAMAGLAKIFFLGEKFVPGGKTYGKQKGYNPQNRATSSPGRYLNGLYLEEKYPGIHLGSPTLQWLYQSISYIIYLRKWAGKIETPLLLFQVENDGFVMPEGQTRVVSKGPVVRAQESFRSSSRTLYGSRYLSRPSFKGN